jgi:23S rRNA pseudouridine2605 synthase
MKKTPTDKNTLVAAELAAIKKQRANKNLPVDNKVSADKKTSVDKKQPTDKKLPVGRKPSGNKKPAVNQIAATEVDVDLPLSRLNTSGSEKLQKVLARAGLGSRRELEKWIAEGRITINGKVAGLGDRVETKDRLCVDGKPMSSQRLEGPRVRVLLYNKPIGEICTRSDPEGRPTIFSRLPPLEKGRWIAVGRLDLNTSGLLLLTSDGELANKLMHPSAQIDREYLVRVMGAVDTEMLQRLREGVELDDGVAQFTDVAPMHKDDSESINRWYCCTLMEGRNREVRRLWESQGLKVSRLKRVRFGPVFLANKVPEGRWEELTPGELAILYQEAGLPVPDIKQLTPADLKQMERQRRKPMRRLSPGRS